MKKQKIFSSSKIIFIILLLILIVQILEFPAPIGFETRPQNNVNVLWLIPFLILWILEIFILIIIHKNLRLGAKLSIIVVILNIWGVISDQLHLFQPEVASLGYSILEGIGFLLSLTLLYISVNVIKKRLKNN